MERVNKKYADLLRIHKALGASIKRYREAIDKKMDEETQDERRDSLIKRFELTYDLLWKYLREYVIEYQGLTFDAPRKVFQQCLASGITNAEETDQLNDLIGSRNLTTHVYDINLANEVALVISQYYDLIHTIVMRITPNSIQK